MQMISDPRRYCRDYPRSNNVISLAIATLADQLQKAALDDKLAKLLQQENDALINVALNLAPSVEVCQVIWEALNRVINSEEQNSYASIFAIPLILVAGSKNKVQLKETINTELLNNYFCEKGIFKGATDYFISGKLIDSEQIAQIKPSQLYYWVRNLHQAHLWLPIELHGRKIEVLNEGVFLRFLLGVSTDKSSLNQELINDNLMGVMQLIHAELKMDGVTLFPIPFAPVPLSSAFTHGVKYRTEIAIQVALSNVVRKIREQGLTAIAKIAHADEAIQIVVMTKEPSDITETSVWTLTKFDDFEKTIQSLLSLLHDIGVEVSHSE